MYPSAKPDRVEVSEMDSMQACVATALCFLQLSHMLWRLISLAGGDLVGVGVLFVERRPRSGISVKATRLQASERSSDAQARMLALPPAALHGRRPNEA